MPLLKNDIISAFKKTKYGDAGSDVQVITRHGNILIVEDEFKNRFPVCEDEITDNIIKSEPVKLIIPEPFIIKKSATRPKATKQSAPEQKSLF